VVKVDLPTPPLPVTAMVMDIKFTNQKSGGSVNAG
jgi:hypothetical protein